MVLAFCAECKLTKNLCHGNRARRDKPAANGSGDFFKAKAGFAPRVILVHAMYWIQDVRRGLLWMSVFEDSDADCR